MRVFVRGMDMPENCLECRFQTDRGFCKAKPPEFAGYTGVYEFDPISDWCPLVEIITCKDCSNKQTDDSGAIYCRQWDKWEMPEDGYCYLGRRKYD